MKITHSLTHMKCDLGGCANTAEYIISNIEQNKKHNIYFCAKCMKDLYLVLAKMYTPKSPRNKLNREYSSEIKKLFEKGDK